MTSQVITASNGDVRLRRELGLFSAISMIVGVMIGSGVFVSPSSALAHSGSVGFCLLVWAICGVISLLGALAFAELGTVVPRSGAEYAYFLESFGDKNKFWGPLPAFVCSWVYVVVLRPAEVAVIVLTFAEYAVQPFVSCNQGDLIKKIVALLAIGLITFINITSVKLYVKLQNVFATCKVVACLVVIAGGLFELWQGRVERLSSGFAGTTTSPGSIALAFYSGLWAYDGWSSVTTVTEEIQKPEVNIPRSIAIAVPLITALYVSMNAAYLAVLDIPEMIASPAVGLAFGERALGPFACVIPLGVAISTFGCALSIQFGVTRLCYVAAQEGHMAQALSYVHITRMTPAPAVALQGIISAAFMLSGDVIALIDFASFLIWFFYGCAMVSLLVLRKSKANVHRPYKVPTIIPIFILLVAVFLSVMPIATDPSPKFLFAVGFILSGVAVYIPLVYYKKKPSWMEGLTYLIQVLFEVVPPKISDD
ncbi:b(0,+)-type amino acid transporter 1-like [Ctenocephalides felis]|uniref:b(0,+)-type amino acid transporter 1-like n=1 Tax=Ctenocephalides felis TaxID=7515 RepID=UPI000E6E2492|nr:b(0,+)-type amino acid transporter 1-like [Ctenocephalides felis]